MNKLLSIISLLLFASITIGQTEEKILLNKGVEAYNKQQYITALNYFNKGYEINGDYNASLFNSGNTAFLNDSINIAKDLFSEYVSTVDNKIDKSRGYYNLGNVQYKEYEQLKSDPKKSRESIKVLKESIESYKNAIRNNPKDIDARHNLGLAMSKLPPPDKKENKDNEENKDNKDGEDNEEKNNENKDGENKEDQQKEDENKKEDGEKGEEDKKNENGDDKKEGEDENSKENKEGEDDKKDGQSGKEGDQEKKEEEMKGQISRMQATKDLDAMNNDEQKILMKVNRKKGGEQKENSSSKDW